MQSPQPGTNASPPALSPPPSPLPSLPSPPVPQPSPPLRILLPPHSHRQARLFAMAAAAAAASAATAAIMNSLSSQKGIKFEGISKAASPHIDIEDTPWEYTSTITTIVTFTCPPTPPQTTETFGGCHISPTETTVVQTSTPNSKFYFGPIGMITPVQSWVVATLMIWVMVIFTAVVVILGAKILGADFKARVKEVEAGIEVKKIEGDTEIKIAEVTATAKERRKGKTQ
ncbi:hypothetical protein DFH27DRAFT_585120 [Peziza echinospora]|nr:hypothetical protein DFH27DRAFT_585120 [Peziza echinospora]